MYPKVILVSGKMVKGKMVKDGIFLEIFNIIPWINCVGKEAVLLPGGLTSYFVKRIGVTTSIQKRFGGRKESCCF